MSTHTSFSYSSSENNLHSSFFLICFFFLLLLFSVNIIDRHQNTINRNILHMNAEKERKAKKTGPIVYIRSNL